MSNPGQEQTYKFFYRKFLKFKRKRKKYTKRAKLFCAPEMQSISVGIKFILL